MAVAYGREQHRGDHGYDERAGGHEYPKRQGDWREEVDEEEDQQRADVDEKLGAALRRGFAGHSGGSHAIARATARGSKGRRSSACSPTPMAWKGSPYFSAAASSTPPRAVPSSFVMMSPVTPAVSRISSTCASAVWPVV